MVSARPTPQLFLVDLATSPPSSFNDAADVSQALVASAHRMVARGAGVRVLVSTFVPAENRWVCVFEADDEATARRTVDLAQIPERHVRAGIDLTAFSTLTSAIA